jgi:hypothetical protein
MGLCLVVGCDYTLAGKWEYKELRRVKSPDSQMEAVLVEGNGGATTSTLSSIYLIAAGATLDLANRDKSLFDADHVSGFDVAWASSDLLHIRYAEARILNFRNFGYGPGSRVIEIQLHPATTNYALPMRDRLRQ